LSIAFPDGAVVDNTFDDDPVSFTIGDGFLDEGLELALIGLKAGDHQSLTLMPGQAFGIPDSESIKLMPLSAFNDDMLLEPGVIIAFTSSEGEELAGTVREVSGNEVEVDFNHPLAGREIIFKVEVLSVDNTAC
jgi:FKBP-type peptidyl-prolyl cis-trans isomerase SlpA